MPTNRLEINPETAARYAIEDGDVVKVTTRRGSIEIAACITDTISADVLFTTFHFAESPANVLTNAAALDPVCKIPEFKVSAARIEKV